jgi:hypothetical protein
VDEIQPMLMGSCRSGFLDPGKNVLMFLSQMKRVLFNLISDGGMVLGVVE